jgi:hypothetical protein
MKKKGIGKMKKVKVKIEESDDDYDYEDAFIDPNKTKTKIHNSGDISNFTFKK